MRCNLKDLRGGGVSRSGVPGDVSSHPRVVRCDERATKERTRAHLFLSSTAMTDADGTEKPPPPAGDENDQQRLPKVTLNTPPTQEDIPQLLSTLKLFRHQFSPRERHCLGKHPVLGPLYEGVQVSAGKGDESGNATAVLGISTKACCIVPAYQQCCSALHVSSACRSGDRADSNF